MFSIFTHVTSRGTHSKPGLPMTALEKGLFHSLTVLGKYELTLFFMKNIKAETDIT